MILRKYMARLGIGSAKIDLILVKVIYKSGEEVKGHFHVKGGTIDQQLKRIDCDFVRSNVKKGSNKEEKVIDSVTIFTTKNIESDVVSKIPFTFLLPKSIEINNDFTYRFKSRLTFSQGVESFDFDDIQITEN